MVKGKWYNHFATNVPQLVPIHGGGGGGRGMGKFDMGGLHWHSIFKGMPLVILGRSRAYFWYHNPLFKISLHFFRPVRPSDDAMN